MANKEQELVVKEPVSSWNGTLLNYLGTRLLQLLVFGVFAAVGLYVACMKVVGQGGAWYEDIMNPTVLLMVIGGIAIFGFGFCWAAVIGIKYAAKHTEISGQKVYFNAGLFNLFFNCIKWAFFVVITAGIYLLWIPVQWKKWRAKHTETYYEEEDEDEEDDEEEEEEEEKTIAYPITYYTVDDEGNYEEMKFESEDEDEDEE